MFDLSNNLPGSIELGAVNPGRSCGDLRNTLSTISIQAPAVVLATDDSVADILVPNTLKQCRKVWEYNGGITVGLVGNSISRLVSMATQNTGSGDVAMSFVQTQDTSTLTTTNVTHYNTKNITCIHLTRGEHAKFFFNVSPIQHQTHYPQTTKKDYTQKDHSTHQVSTTHEPDLKEPPAPDFVLISVVVSAVVGLVLVSVLLWKVCSEEERNDDDGHIWTIPPGVAFPGLLRSSSLPASSSTEIASDDAASCRSLPAALHSIEPTYSEIPDDIAAAQRPLPGLPNVYWEIPDDAISGVIRPASIPGCARGGVQDDAASFRSLPAVLQSIEPTYSQVPDHMAAAQISLPAPPRPHTDSEIPDDEGSGPVPFYADTAELSFHIVRNRRQRRRMHRCGRSITTYGSGGLNKVQRSPFYRKAPEIERKRDHRQLKTALVSQPAKQGARTYVNVTDPILSRGKKVTEAQIPGEGTRNTPRRASLSTLPNTYWPWEIQGEGARSTPRRASLPTLPNTYWPWEIPGEGTRCTPRRASLCILLNTYWPWEIRGEGTLSIPRRSSPSFVTPQNTYCPWETTGEGTRNTQRRTSVPLVTLPNTYWPWGIPGDETWNTQRRTSLPLVTLPNTYWPWEIPGDETRNTQRRTSLPLVTLPNTYWPWEIPGDETCNTQRRTSLPLVTLPNTYWPWEIPGDETCNTQRRTSLPLVTLPNTYWPWEIPGDETRSTQRRASLPLVTLPNTYWPWEIPGDETCNTQRRASLPLVTLPNTYLPWEIPGEGTRNTPQETFSLPLPITS
ncbi:Hypp4199 [Branchiostoma lanceolatum]|uniref:Hypp4199 protein n=1 Tax=Branchiostoma lanceolatum TaxID=7740 RepID=A0A8K0A7K5_BRALA|nr:Hypp4199 [Branchiostoma lanceolatum]